MKYASLLLLAPLGLGACGGGDDDAAGADAGFNCEADQRDEAFVAGMEKTGELGITFRLVSSDPAPPARDDNTWVIELEDGDGPLVGADLDITPFMPDHNHGTSIPEQVTEDTQVPGRYTATRVNLFMPGIWEITVEATPSGGTAADTDAVVFTFCVAS